MRSERRTSGYTMMEMMIALFLAFIVVLALGKIVLVNQRSWEWGRDKSVLQANVTEALENMARSIRAARAVWVYQSNHEFRTFVKTADFSADSLVDTFSWNPSTGRLQRNGVDLTSRRCTSFRAIAGPDTTSPTPTDSACLVLRLTLADDSGKTIEALTSATVRNRSFVY